MISTEVRNNMGVIGMIIFLTTWLFTIHAIYGAKNDTLHINGSISDGQTLVSSSGIFQVDFLTPGKSGNRHLGVRYTHGVLQVFVWIANRHIPLRNKQGVLRFIDPGVLLLLNDTGGTVWSSTAPTTPLRNPVAQILDSGNLVVRDANDDRPENYAWQSFDHPTDTYLPGMKLGVDFETGSESYLSSWTSDDDPGPGDFSLHLDPTGYPQIVVKMEKEVRYRGVVESGEVRPSGPEDSTSRLILEMTRKEVSYREETVSGSSLWRSRLSQGGIWERYAWSNVTQDWFLYVNKSGQNKGDVCDSYNYCGANRICRFENSASCTCPQRFFLNDMGGCSRRTPLSCSQGVFLNYSSIRLPDTRNSWYNDSIEECGDECLKNCSCVAYAELDLGSDGGTRCLFYSGDLMDLTDQGGDHLYIRMNSSESGSVADESKRGRSHRVLIVGLTSSAGVLLVVALICLTLYVRRKVAVSDNVSLSELPFFSLSAILKATYNFSVENRLGEGGFGAVYRGVLDDGEEVAVKRLSKSSAQGVDELKNEVILIAKLQHRNLVRLLGCCVEGQENLLVYEYMPNKSLNLMLFDETKSMLLDWQKRFNIINGIAKGLLYLHQDSRLRIIHRDLKLSNVLLDHDMNPRISDFGMARSVRGNETEVRTHNVVGTYGYMPPEYAGGGVYSVKSDVYSFGVLVLEVVSGRRNRGLISIGDHDLSLVGHAWNLEQEGNPLAIVDASLGEAFVASEVVRSIEVALLCVQKYPEDRPMMSSVVFMLGNEVAVPKAKEPGFYMERDGSHVGNATSSSTNPPSSQNEITISIPYPR